MIHYTKHEDLNGAICDLKIEYAYYPEIQEVVVLEVYEQRPVKHIDDLQWVELYSYDDEDMIRFEGECLDQALKGEVT